MYLLTYLLTIPLPALFPTLSQVTDQRCGRALRQLYTERGRAKRHCALCAKSASGKSNFR